MLCLVVVIALVLVFRQSFETRSNPVVNSFTNKVKSFYHRQASNGKTPRKDCKTFKQATGTMIPLVYVGSI